MKTTMLPVELLAISKLLTEKNLKEARSKVRPGEHHVRKTLDLDVTLRVGHDYDAPHVSKICPWQILLAVLNTTVGGSKERSRHIVERAIDDVLGGWKPDPDIEELKAWVESTKERIKNATMTRHNGQVTVPKAFVNGERWR